MSDKKYDTLTTGSGTYLTTFNRMHRARKPWVVADPGKVLSFMPGTIEQIKVKVGDRVHEGDSLMIFRAMKMNNNILSPVDGTVAAINVAPGENIRKDVVMIELE